MARLLRILKDFTPNVKNGKYLAVSDIETFISLTDTYMVDEITLDNYRINTNVAKIKYTDDYEETINNNITYLIEYDYSMVGEDMQINYFRCYFVDNFNLQSGYIVFNLHIDLWQSYIFNAKFKNTILTRSNRRVNSYGVYDEIQNTNDGYSIHYEAPIYTAWLDRYSDGPTGYYPFAKESEIYIVYLIQYNIEQQVFGDDHISATCLYATPLDEIRTAVNNGDYSTIKGATNIIGGIYGVTGKFGSTLDAQVIEAWILPTWFINIGSKSAGGSGTTYYHNFKTKSEHGDLTIKGYVVNPSKNTLEYRSVANDINKVTYFGTINNGLKLKRYTYDTLHCFVSCFVGATSIQVIAMQGEEQKDLTKDFTIMLTENSGVTTGIRAVAKALSRSISMGGSMWGDIKKADYGMAGLGFVKGIADMIPLKPSIDKAIGNGDASTLYYRNQNQTSGDPKYNCVQNPFVITTFTSVENENEKARRFGASFYFVIEHEQMSLIYQYLTSFNLLGSGTFDDTLIALDTCVYGIPQDACTYIRDTLKAGVYLNATY